MVFYHFCSKFCTQLRNRIFVVLKQNFVAVKRRNVAAKRRNVADNRIFVAVKVFKPFIHAVISTRIIYIL